MKDFGKFQKVNDPEQLQTTKFNILLLAEDSTNLPTYLLTTFIDNLKIGFRKHTLIFLTPKFKGNFIREFISKREMSRPKLGFHDFPFPQICGTENKI